MAAVLETMVGAPAIVHQEYAGNCLDNGPTTRCVEVGMDPLNGFDCSGLVIYGIAKVRGINTSNWPLDRRHVRDFWRTESIGELGLTATEVNDDLASTIGSILVWKRRANGEIYPGHVAVVTYAKGKEVSIIHTSQNKQQVVRQRAYLDSPNVMGIMRINEV